MQDHTKLLVWQKARVLTVNVHRAVRFRSSAAPGLRPQLLRATMSISANIAEGTWRPTQADFARFLSMSIASCGEVEHHLTVAMDLRLIAPSVYDDLMPQVVEIRKMLVGLRRAVLRGSTEPEP